MNVTSSYHDFQNDDEYYSSPKITFEILSFQSLLTETSEWCQTGHNSLEREGWGDSIQHMSPG